VSLFERNSRDVAKIKSGEEFVVESHFTALALDDRFPATSNSSLFLAFLKRFFQTSLTFLPFQMMMSHGKFDV
jgi:hypothetical protein